MNKNIRKISDGAMMLAILGAAVLLDRQFAGLFSGYMLWLMPMPMVFYSAKYGWKDSLPVLTAAALIILIFGYAFTAFYGIVSCVIGVAYGSGVYEKKEGRILLLRTMVLSVIMEFLAAYVFASVIGYDITAEMADYEKIIEMFSANSAAAIDLSSMISARTLFVMSIVMLGILEGYITHVLSVILLKRLNLPTVKSSPVRDWYPAKWTGYAGIICLVMNSYLTFNKLPSEALQAAGQTAGFFGSLYLALLGIIGMVIVIPAKYPSMKGWLLPLIIVLTIGFMPLVSAFGFLYITTDLHERAVKGEF